MISPTSLGRLAELVAPSLPRPRCVTTCHQVLPAGSPGTSQPRRLLLCDPSPGFLHYSSVLASESVCIFCLIQRAGCLHKTKRNWLKLRACRGSDDSRDVTSVNSHSDPRGQASCLCVPEEKKKILARQNTVQRTLDPFPRQISKHLLMLSGGLIT